MKKNTVQAKKWLDKCYPDSAPSKATVERWFAEFKCGRTRTDDAERCGRPNEVVTPENVKNVHKIILENRKVKLQEVADTMKMSKGSIYTILHEHLHMRKLFSKWVPRSLTIDQKQQRVDASGEWRNCTNWASNCCRTHPTLQIWPPATIGYFHNLKNGSPEKNFTPTMRWSLHVRRILKARRNHFLKRVLKC